MSDENQILVPPSFIALFVEPGRSAPGAARAHIAERYALCEDMANLLVTPAQTLVYDQGLGEGEVLRRCRLGMGQGESTFGAAEADWVVRRLAELLDWAPLAVSD